MDFGERRLLRHRRVYRTINLPFGIARLWSGVEEVSFEYVEARDEVIVRPVRHGASSSTTIKAKPDQNHLPSNHFKVQ